MLYALQFALVEAGKVILTGVIVEKDLFDGWTS